MKIHYICVCYIYLSSSALCGNSSFKQFIKTFEKISKSNFASGPKLLHITCDNLSFRRTTVTLHNVPCVVCHINDIDKYIKGYIINILM